MDRRGVVVVIDWREERGISKRVEVEMTWPVDPVVASF
jgi:hypothetical protein